MVYTIVIAVSILFVSGCSTMLFDPKPILLETELSYGPPPYKQGYQDGCESALGAYGNSMQRTYYGLRKTAEYQDNRMYNQVYKDAWAYCYMWLYMQRKQNTDSIHQTPF